MQPRMPDPASPATHLSAAARVPADAEADPVRDRLIQAALELLRDHGPAAVRMREVAERAGCSTMGLYTRFGSKDRLVDELYRFGFLELRRALALVAPTEDPSEHVVQLALGYRRFALDNPALHGLMFERAMADFIPSHEARIEALAPYEQLTEAVGACGVVGPASAWTAYLFWGAAHGLVSLELTHRRWGGAVMPHLQQIDSEAAYRAGLRAVLQGLLQSRPRSDAGPTPAA
jgi:AcrR family transcriptional regulator